MGRVFSQPTPTRDIRPRGHAHTAFGVTLDPLSLRSPSYETPNDAEPGNLAVCAKNGLALETFDGNGRLNAYGPSEGSATIYEVEAEPAKGGACEPR